MGTQGGVGREMESTLRIGNYNQVVDMITDKNMRPSLASKLPNEFSKFVEDEDLNKKIAQL